MLQKIWNSTLNSVIFGIALMVLVALYIAIGSGVPSVREAFEMNELQFFSAWPLKMLMSLLVLNLAVVTFTRIPFSRRLFGEYKLMETDNVLLTRSYMYLIEKPARGA